MSGEHDRIYKLGELVLDAEAYAVETKDGRRRLTRAEFEVLQLLIRRPDRVYTYAEIADAYAGDGQIVAESAVRVMIHRVRRKLGTDGPRIRALRGVGFFITDETEDKPERTNGKPVPAGDN